MIDGTVALDLLIRWGYVFLFLTAAAEATPLLGMLIPGQAVIVLAGFLAAQGHLDLTTVLLVSFAAGLIGDGLGYWAGRTRGRDLLDRHGPRFNLDEARIERAERLFRRWGPFALVPARFSFLTRGLAPLLAGMSRMRPATYWAITTPGAAAWALWYGLLGYAFGESWTRLESVLGNLLLAAALLVAAAYALHRILRRFTGLPPRETALASLAITAFAGFLWLTHHVTRGAPPAIDQAYPGLAATLAAHVPLWTLVSYPGNLPVVAALTLVLAAALHRRDPWSATALALAVFGERAITYAAKFLIGRERPPGTLIDTFAPAFPSGHAATSVVLAALAGYLALRHGHPRRHAVPALAAGALFIALTGLARIGLRAHYPSDILGGLLLGTAWASLVLLLVEHHRRTRAGTGKSR